jgi:hypothetical protein
MMRTDSFLRFYYTVEPPRVYPIPSSAGDLSVALSQGTVLATTVAKRCGMGRPLDTLPRGSPQPGVVNPSVFKIPPRT